MSPLRVGLRTPINNGPYSSNFCPQHQTLAGRDFLPCEFNSSPPGEIEARRSKRGTWGVCLSCSCHRRTIRGARHCHQEFFEPRRHRSLFLVHFLHRKCAKRVSLTCRPRRTKPHRKCCTIARAWTLSNRRPWRPSGSVQPGQAEEEGSRLEQR
jgi:hypothetical protein